MPRTKPAYAPELRQRILDVFRQAEIPRKIVQNSPSARGDFCLAPLTHESVLHPIAFPLKE